MSEKKITIRLERKDDYHDVENLTRESFWNVYRPGCMEHYVLHCYRNDPAFVPELDFVMELDGELIGQVIYVRSEIDCGDGRKVPIMTFGPIGIAPAYKRQGYGKQLLDYSMEKAREMGAGALAITGNILFYGKSGFVPAKTKPKPHSCRPSSSCCFRKPRNMSKISQWSCACWNMPRCARKMKGMCLRSICFLNPLNAENRTASLSGNIRFSN